MYLFLLFPVGRGCFTILSLEWWRGSSPWGTLIWLGISYWGGIASETKEGALTQRRRCTVLVYWMLTKHCKWCLVVDRTAFGPGTRKGCANGKCWRGSNNIQRSICVEWWFSALWLFRNWEVISKDVRLWFASLSPVFRVALVPSQASWDICTMSENVAKGLQSWRSWPWNVTTVESHIDRRLDLRITWGQNMGLWVLITFQTLFGDIFCGNCLRYVFLYVLGSSFAFLFNLWILLFSLPCSSFVLLFLPFEHS